MAIAHLLATVATAKYRSSHLRVMPMEVTRLIEAAILKILSNSATFHGVWHTGTLLPFGKGSLRIIGELG